MVKENDLDRKKRDIYEHDNRVSLVERQTVDSAIMEKIEKMEQRLDRIEKMARGIKKINGKLREIEAVIKTNSWNGQSVLESADVHKSFYGIYRVPTQFTTWIISVLPERNQGLDLSGLYEIEVRFSGSFIAVARVDNLLI